MADRPPAFFEPTDSGLRPHPDARGPWAETMMHGRLLAGLAAWAIEREHGGAGFLPVRLTVDLYRSPAMEMTAVGTTVVRAGGRVRAIDAHVTVGGVDVARASTLWLKKATPPEDDDAPQTTGWDVAAPDSALIDGGGAFEVRDIDGRAFGAPGPRRAWLRDVRDLVEGEALTPFVRAALAADYASPLANSSSAGLDYINADLSRYLGRLPDDQWIGVEFADRVATDGVSVAYTRLYDRRGPIGWSTVCAVLAPRMAP
jgi:hypothetical protein